jgi:hypothetical protein
MGKFIPHPKKNRFNPDIVLGPRPKHKDLVNGRISAASILCLLKPEELQGNTMQLLAVDAGYQWINVPSDARPWSSEQSTPQHWLAVAVYLDELLKDGKTYVHCAAGIHRTGIAAYTWYRKWGGVDTHKEAFYYIVQHRPVIETDIGEKILPMRHYFDRGVTC